MKRAQSDSEFQGQLSYTTPNKYVLAINEGGSDNLGDQAISKSLEALLLERGCRVETYNFTSVRSVDLAKEILHTNVTLRLNTVRKSFVRSILSKIVFLRQIRWVQNNIKQIIVVARKKHELALIGGGQLILSNTIFPIAMFSWIIVLRLFGTKVAIIGVGSGDEFNLLDRVLYKTALKLCSKILLRDHDSIEKVNASFGVTTEFIPDLAFYYSKPNNRTQNNNIQKKLLVGIIDYPVFCIYCKEAGNNLITEGEYIKRWADDILCINLNISKITLASTTSEDLIWSNKLYNHMCKLEVKCEIDLVNKVTSLEEYVTLLMETDVVMSARMHTLILAQSLGCKVVPWRVSKKIISYEKEYTGKNIIDMQDKIAKEVSSLLGRF